MGQKCAAIPKDKSMSQGQDKLYWMAHKQDYEMCCCIWQETTLWFRGTVKSR